MLCQAYQDTPATSLGRPRQSGKLAHRDRAELSIVELILRSEAASLGLRLLAGTAIS